MIYPKRAAFLRLAVFSALFATPLGCSGAPPVAPASPPAVVAPAAAVTTRAGVRYDATAPLEAVVSPTFDAANKPAEALTYAVRFKGANGETVPAIYTVPAKATGSSPCIVLLHGLGGNKEQMGFLLGLILARRGYASIAIDIAGHGARPKINNKKVADLDINETRQASAQTIADLRRTMDFLQTRPEVDKKRVGFVGLSLGGILGSVFVGDEPRIRAAALLSAGGNWGKIIATSQHAFAVKFRREGMTDATTIEAKMGDVDPLVNIAAIAPRPLLFINGDKDMIIPTATTDELYAKAREPKKRVVLPGGHVPNLSQVTTQTLEWLDVNVKSAK